jgi:hypothetical protein
MIFVDVTVVFVFSLAVSDVVHVKVVLVVANDVTSQTNGALNVRVIEVGKREVSVSVPELHRVIVAVVRDPPVTVTMVNGVEMIDVSVRVNTPVKVNVLVIMDVNGIRVVKVVDTLVAYVFVKLDVVLTNVVLLDPPETVNDVMIVGTSTIPVEVDTIVVGTFVVTVFVYDDVIVFVPMLVTPSTTSVMGTSMTVVPVDVNVVNTSDVALEKTVVGCS